MDHLGYFAFIATSFVLAVKKSALDPSSSSMENVNQPSILGSHQENILTEGLSKEELRRLKRKEYQRNYRRLYPEKARESVRKSTEKRNKDPIRSAKRTLYRQKYNREYERLHPFRRKKQNNIQPDIPKQDKGKRKRVDEDVDDVKPKMTRVRTFGRAPRSDTFLNMGEHVSYEPISHPRSNTSSEGKTVVSDPRKFNKPNVMVRIKFPPNKYHSPETDE
jgi:hypothetical protein